MKRMQLLLSALLLVLLLATCAPQAAPAPAPQALAPAAASAPAPAAALIAPVKAAWEVEWERAVGAARKEGELVAFTSDAAYRTGLAPLFKQKFGVVLECLVAKGSVVAPKVLAERRAGIYSYDIIFAGGPTTLNDLKPAGVFDPMEPILIIPEVTDPKGWYGNKLPWLDRDHTILYTDARVQAALAINTNLVKPEELKSYRDLLDPRWKGKIIMSNPLGSGSGSKTMGVVADQIMGWDYFRELAKNQPVIIQDEVQGRDWLALGKAAIVFGPKPSLYIEVMRVGVPINLHNPQEGSYLSLASPVTFVNRAPHPNAAKVFINWFLSREGLTAATRATGEQSSRDDIPTDFLDPRLVRKPGVKYLIGGGEEFELNQPNVIKKLTEIFAAK